MYLYHNRVKQRISNHELNSYEFSEKFKSISPCLFLYFETEPRIRTIQNIDMRDMKSYLKDLLKKEIQFYR
jgi:hypothetical protein